MAITPKIFSGAVLCYDYRKKGGGVKDVQCFSFFVLFTIRHRIYLIGLLGDAL